MMSIAKIKKAWLWLKEYWYIPAAIVVLVVLMVLGFKDKDGPQTKIIEMLAKKKKDLNLKFKEIDKEVQKKIEDVSVAHVEEIKKIEEDTDKKLDELKDKKNETIKHEEDKAKTNPRELEDWFNDHLNK